MYSSLDNLVNFPYEKVNEGGLIGKIKNAWGKIKLFSEFGKNSLYNISMYSRIAYQIERNLDNIKENLDRLYRARTIKEEDYRENIRLIKITKGMSKLVSAFSIGLTLFGAILGGYFFLHNIYSQPPGEHLNINGSYAGIIPTNNGKVEVVIDQNGHLDVLGTYNGIVYHNQNVPYYENPVNAIQNLQQFDQQIVPQHPDYQYLNWTLILYSPNGHITLPITNNGYIDLSNINPNDIAAVATTNQYLIPLVKAILSQQGKLYVISANGAQYLYYNYPSIEEIDRETMDLQHYGPYWAGGAIYIVTNNSSTELIPIANTLTIPTGPALTPVGSYNGSS